MADRCELSPLGWRNIWELTLVSGTWPAEFEPRAGQDGGDKQTFVLGRERRLLVCARDSEPISAEAFDVRLVDLSDQWRSLNVSGPSARALLARGMEIALPPAGLPVGAVRQTLCAGVPVIVHAKHEQAVELLIPSSFAPWLAAWLVEALSIFLSATSEARA